jgi:hypothetical protein
MRTGYRDLTFAAVDGAAADCFAGADGPEPVPVTIGGVNGMYVEPYGDPSVQVTQPQGDGTTTAAYALPFEDQTLCVYLSWDADISAEELEAARQVVESIRGHRHRAGVQFILTLPAGWHTG